MKYFWKISSLLLFVTLKPPELIKGFFNVTKIYIPVSHIQKYQNKSTTIQKLSFEAVSFKFFNKTELIFIDYSLPWNSANLFCQNKFKANLLVVPSEDDDDKTTKMSFLHLLLNTMGITENVWINGRHTFGQWVYHQYHEVKVPFNLAAFGTHVDNLYVKNSKNVCLSAYSAENVTTLYIVDCGLARRFICERPFNQVKKSLHSTHKNWIKIGSKFYKLFAEITSYEEAAQRCASEDPSATLAASLTAIETIILGHYMHSSKPAIRTAWLGAVFSKYGWVFPSEDFIVPWYPQMDHNGLIYPKYSEPRPRNPSLENYCLALVLTSKIASFKEVLCSTRLQGFICYKLNLKINTDLKFVCHDKQYELSREPASFPDAVRYCKSQGAKVAEPRNKEQLMCLANMMRVIAKEPMAHLWLGATRTQTEDLFMYNSDKTSIRSHIKDDELWLMNLTLVPHISQLFTCLNMDVLGVENVILYGTNCLYMQHFSCEFEDY